MQASENRLEMLGKELFFAPIASVFGSLNCQRVSIRLGVMQSDIGMIFRPVFNVTGSLNIARYEMLIVSGCGRKPVDNPFIRL